MNIEQEKMIVESLPSLYPLQKFEEEAINALVSLPIDDDAISRKAAIELCDWYDNQSMREDLEKLRPVRFSTDTISRAKAIDGKICIRRSNGVEIYDDYVVPVEYLEQLPPAQPEIVTCDKCVSPKRSECIWHNAGATYCSFGEVTE